jgi:surface protein
MFSGCESLKFLDISNFNMEKITKGESMFNGIKNLKYVNLYNIPKSYNFINESGLDKIENLTVCQKQKIISSENITENCCYYDLNTNECSTSTNYIIIFYGDTAEYPNGFIKNEDDIQFREGIDFIINGEDHNKKLDGTTELILHKGSKIEVYFSNSIPLTSTQSYFDSTKDRNAGKIVSIDFHHFNSSNINDMSSMFYGCSSLKSLDLSNFDTSLATNINLMFYECSSLESLDLSNFDTS